MSSCDSQKKHPQKGITTYQAIESAKVKLKDQLIESTK